MWACRADALTKLIELIESHGAEVEFEDQRKSAIRFRAEVSVPGRRCMAPQVKAFDALVAA